MFPLKTCFSNTIDVMLQNHSELGMLWVHNVASCQSLKAFNKQCHNVHQKADTSFSKYIEVGLLLRKIGA